MLKILVWVVSEDTQFFNKAIKILERQHNGVELVGLTAIRKVELFTGGKNVLNVPFIPLEKLTGGGVYDILLVVGARQVGMSKIVQAARKLNLPEEKLLGDYIVTIPGFTLDKYRKLQRSRLSIISISCFGGAISHTLGLPFLSPFINMCLEECDYLRFLCSPRVHMAEKLVFKETCFEKNLKINYPVFTLDDVELHMNHYRDFDEAVKSWERRKARINWYNLFVMMFTDSEETLAEFDTLPYGKKVCFVPFKSDLDSAFYVNPKVDKTEPEFGLVINNFGNGRFFYYDPFDMLLYGKKTQLIDM